MEFLTTCDGECCQQWNTFTKDADSDNFTDTPLLEKYCVARVDRLSDDEKHILLDCITGNDILQQCVSLRRSEEIEDDTIYEQLDACFYNVVRLGNVNLLKLLIRRASLDDYITNSCSERILERILGKTYDELKWKNVYLPNEMEEFVMNTLTSMRFFSDKENIIPKEKHLQDARLRVEVICSGIEYLIREYKSKDVDMVFLATGIYVAQRLTTLKRIMKVSYTILPWEEIEFCLVKFISTHFENVDYIYKLILTKEDILLYLEAFLKKLKDTDVDLTTRVKKTKREENMKLIVNENETFKGLYSKFELMKDIHSLKYIETYITPTVCINLDENELLGKFAIQRTLQVLGENLKSTTESPNISDGVSKIISELAPRQLKEIMTALRNPLSHAYSLTNKLKIEENKLVFATLQNDLKKINNVLGRILYKLKLQAIKTFLQQILDCENLNDLKCQIGNVDIPNEFKTEYEISLTSEFSGMRNMIDQTYHLAKNESVREIVEKVRTKFNDIGIDNDKSTYIYLSTCLHDLLTQIRRGDNLESIKRKTSIILKKLIQIIEEQCKGINEIKPYVVKMLVELKDEPLKNMIDLPLKIYHHFEVELIHLRSIETTATFGNRLEESIKRDDEIFRLFEDVKDDIKFPDDLKLFSETVAQVKHIYEVKSKLLRLFDKKGKEHNEICHEDNRYKLSNVNCENAGDKTGQGNCDISKGKGFKKTKDKNKIKQSNKTKKSTDTNNQITYTSKNQLETCDISAKSDIESQYGGVCNDKGKQENGKACKDSSNKLNMGKNASKGESEVAWAIKDASKNKNSDEIDTITNNQKSNYTNNEKHSTDHTNKVAIDTKEINSDDEKKSVVELLENFKLTNKEKIINLYEQTNFEKCKSLLSLAVTDKFSDFVKKIGKSSLGSRSNDLKLFLESLDVKEELVSKLVEMSRKQIQHDFEKRLTILLELLKDKKGTDDISKRYVQMCTEMLLIDLFEMLESANLLGNNRGNLYRHSPLLTGRELRNYLAHGDPLIDILPFSTSAAMLSNVWKLEDAIAFFTNNDMKIDQKFAGSERSLDEFISLMRTQNEMFTGATEGNITKIKEYLDKGADVKARNNVGQTSLHFAARNDNVEIFKFFLRRNVRMVMDHREVTPLEVAVASGNCKVARYIIEKFNINVSDKIDDVGTTLLHLAAQNGRENVVDMLIKDSDVNAVRETDGTPLHTAVIFGFKEVVRVLLTNGCTVDKLSAANATPLQLAVMYGHDDIVRYLIEQNNGNVYHEKLGRFTLLYIAISKEWETIALYLLDKMSTLENENGEELIYSAASLGLERVVVSLLQKGAEITLNALEAAVTFGHIGVLIALLKKTEVVYQHLLHYAVSHGHKDIIIYLITEHYDVNSLYEFSTPLHFAIDYGSADIVRELLGAKAKVNIVDEFKNTPLHLAAREGHETIVDILLQHDADIHALNINRRTPLLLAVKFGNANIVIKLLKRGAKVDIIDKTGQSPLHMAAAQGYNRIIEELLKNGAQANAVDINLFSPLMRAAVRGHNEAVKLLLKYEADVNYKMNCGMSALSFAALSGHEDVVKTLLKLKHDMVCQRFALDMLIASGKKNMVVTLVKNGLNVDAHDEDRLTPLHCAVFAGHEEMVTTLLDADADVNFKDTLGQNPLHVAANCGFEKIVDVLLKKGALVNETDLNDMTPLHLASGLEFDNTNIPDHLTDESDDFTNDLLAKIGVLDNQYDENLREILQLYKKVTINASNGDENYTALFDDASNKDEAIKSWMKENMTKLFPDFKWTIPKQRFLINSSTEVVMKLIEHGAKVNAEDRFKLTPLHYAACNGFCDIGRVLIKAGANVNAKDEDMMSVLHVAVANNHCDMVELLLDSGAEINSANCTQDTPLQLAQQCRFDDIMKILLDFGADVTAKSCKDPSPLAGNSSTEL